METKANILDNICGYQSSSDDSDEEIAPPKIVDNLKDELLDFLNQV